MPYIAPEVLTKPQYSAEPSHIWSACGHAHRGADLGQGHQRPSVELTAAARDCVLEAGRGRTGCVCPSLSRLTATERPSSQKCSTRSPSPPSWTTCWCQPTQSPLSFRERFYWVRLILNKLTLLGAEKLAGGHNVIPRPQ